MLLMHVTQLNSVVRKLVSFVDPKCKLLSLGNIYVGEWGWGVEGKQVGSMDEESQVRGCYNITFICTPTNQETVSVLEKTQANKTFRT